MGSLSLPSVPHVGLREAGVLVPTPVHSGTHYTLGERRALGPRTSGYVARQHVWGCGPSASSLVSWEPRGLAPFGSQRQH